MKYIYELLELAMRFVKNLLCQQGWLHGSHAKTKIKSDKEYCTNTKENSGPDYGKSLRPY